MSNQTIDFLHPGYSQDNVLLSLPRVDNTDMEDAPLGLHHQTALTACQIVAGNAFDGYLALDKELAYPIDLKETKFLTADEYYFIVPGEIRYPFVPSFRDWEFPHGRVPPHWPQIPIAEKDPTTRVCSVTRLDNSTVDSMVEHSVLEAKLVPTSFKVWFAENRMARYAGSHTSKSAMDADVNSIFLLDSMHELFVRYVFAFAPKPLSEIGLPVNPSEEASEVASDPGPYYYRAHTFTLGEEAFASIWQNTKVVHLDGLAREYLFARFAMAVFENMTLPRFYAQMRSIARFRRFGEEEYPRQIIEEILGDDFYDQYGIGSGERLMFKGLSLEQTHSLDTTDVESLDEPRAGSDVFDPNEPIGVVDDGIIEAEEANRGRPRRKKNITANTAGTNEVMPSNL